MCIINIFFIKLEQKKITIYDTGGGTSSSHEAFLKQVFQWSLLKRVLNAIFIAPTITPKVNVLEREI